MTFHNLTFHLFSLFPKCQSCTLEVCYLITNSLIFPSTSSKFDLFGVERIQVNVDISKLFLTMILPSKANLMEVYILISCLILLILLFKFNPLMFAIVRTSKSQLMIKMYGLLSFAQDK